ncbi:MAG: PAS domain S-box protein [Bacillota bacterium]
MRDEDKTKEQLIREINELRKQVFSLQEAIGDLSQRKDHYYSVINSSVDGIVLTDESGRIIEWNQAMGRITGLSRHGTVGRLCYEVMYEMIPDSKKSRGKYRQMKSLIQEVLSTGMGFRAGQSIEVEIQQPDGRKRYIQDISYPVQTDSGFIISSIIRDITRQKKMEYELENYRNSLENTVKKRTEDLRITNEVLRQEIEKKKMIEEALWESQRRYETLLQVLPVGLFQTDSKGNYVYVNELASEMIGLSFSEIHRWTEALHEDDRERVISEIKRSTEKRSNFKLEYRFKQNDGKVVWVLGQAVPYMGRDSRFMGYVGTLSDITSLKAAERELRQSEKRYRKLINLSPDPIVVHSGGNILFVNKIGAQIYGAESPEQLIGRQLMDFIHPDCKEMVRERVRKMIDEWEGAPLSELKVIVADGSVKDIEVAANPLTYKGMPAIQVVIRDISERKRREEELRFSMELFSRAFNASPNPITISNYEGRYVKVNKSFERIAGYSHEEALGANPLELGIFLDPDNAVKALDLLKRQGELRELEVNVRTKHGELLYGLLSCFIIELGAEKYILTIYNDLTMHINAEAERRNNEQFLNSVFESIQDRLSIIDIEFNIIRVNKKTEKIFEHALPLAGKKCYKVYHGEEDICPGCPNLKVIENRKPANAVICVRDKEGKSIGWLEHFSYPFIDITTGELAGILTYVRDVTEKVKMEQEMARMERFHLIGQMAAGIGHEIRNPMTTVRGFIQLLGNKKEYKAQREYFNLMLSELDRANSIITEYLSLAKNRVVDLKDQNLSDIIKTLQPLIYAEAMDAGINFVLETGSVPNLLLNENEIRQLILNLVKNALESMDFGGSLKISTFVRNSDVILAVHDQGPGIPSEILDQIGTPFFTTKDTGTGLGLAVCYGIASRHNAEITIDTGPGGTTILVRFRVH